MSPMRNIHYYESDVVCPTGYTDLPIMAYPASDEGCYFNGKVTKGKCHSTSGTPVAA